MTTAIPAVSLVQPATNGDAEFNIKISVGDPEMVVAGGVALFLQVLGCVPEINRRRVISELKSGELRLGVPVGFVG